MEQTQFLGFMHVCVLYERTCQKTSLFFPCLQHAGFPRIRAVFDWLMRSIRMSLCQAILTAPVSRKTIFKENNS